MTLADQPTLEAPTATVFGTPVLPPLATGSVPFWRIVLRGISQLGFQTNEVTALVFVLAIAAYGAITDNWQQVGFMLIGAVVGTAAAVAMKPVRATYEIGLLTFNPILMGLALGNFFRPTATLWVTVVVMTAIVGAIAALVDKYVPLPLLAVPFIVPFWIVYAVSESIGLEKLVFSDWETVDTYWLVATIAGMGSTLFAGIILTGIIYFIGMLLSNWKHAVVALLGGVTGAVVATIGEAAGGAINSGFTGFNAVLAALAVYILCGEDLRLAVLGAVTATVLMRAVIWTGLQPLAAGFVLAAWLVLFLTWFQPRFWDRWTPAKTGTPPNL